MSSTAAPTRRVRSTAREMDASTGSSGQLSLALAAREDGIQRASDHANEAWKEAAYAAIVCAASVRVNFTADDVWDRIGPEYQTHEPSALGPLFLAASRAGLIRKVGLRPSRHPRRHRDLTVWQKL